jgi:hypothetical protein
MSPGYGWVTEALRDGTTVPLAESRVLCASRANIESARLLGILP